MNADREGAGPLPLVVIGGWLGAGKTTLVNHLLRHADGRRVAVLVNDFGDVGIDADLIEGAEAGVLSLAGGCLCCSFGDDLVGSLNGLARRTPRPEVVLIELSGVAVPAAVVRTARLSPAVQVVGTLVLADAGAVRRLAADRYVGDTVRQQLLDADWLLLSKGDLVDAAVLHETAEWLATCAPRAQVLTAAPAALPVELLLGWRGDHEGQDVPGATALRSRPIGPAQPPSPFASCSLALPDGADLHTLGQRLVDPARGVLRAKGLARNAAGDGQLLQVAGGRWAVTPHPVQGPGRLVVIGLREAIAALDPSRLLA